LPEVEFGVVEDFSFGGIVNTVRMEEEVLMAEMAARG
jgi:hypothetical protein